MFRIAAALFLFVPCFLFSQGLNPSIEISPNPVPPGTTTITVTITAPRDAGITFSPTNTGLPCDLLLFSGINGANVLCGAINICSTSFVPLAACQSISRTLSVCGTGDFAVRFRYRDALNATRSEWACFRIQANPATEATLNTVAAPQVGQVMALAIAAPADPLSIYFTGISFTSNQGVPVNSNLMAHLDNDILFALSTSGTFPGLFLNFMATPDANGDSPLIMLPLPQDPSLACLPLKAQAVVLDLLLNVRPTNQLNFAVLP